MISPSLILSVPAKTFLLGEYAVLKGGVAYVACTEPRFELHICPGTGALVGIHAQSPAGLYIQKHGDFFAKFNLEFVDPNKIGGLGASTAQFLTAYAFSQWRSQSVLDSEQILDHQKMLQSYLQFAWDGQGTAPSGADLLAQERGLITQIDKASGQINQQGWVFGDLEFYLIHTGQKLATHEHLRKIQEFDAQKMLAALVIAQTAFSEENSNSFVQAVQLYAQALAEQNLTSEHSLQLLAQITKIQGVRAAKACGAMGADVLFVVTERQQGAHLRQWAQQQQLHIIASNAQLVEGMTVRLLKGDLF